jgi:hypothetical protein
MSMIGFRDQEHWGTVYEVMSLTRGDLQSAGLSVAQVDALTDADLHDIASRLGQAILEAGIWDDLPFLARLVLAEKGYAA